VVAEHGGDGSIATRYKFNTVRKL